MTSPAQLEAAKRACTWLKASGIAYAVQFPDGTVEGTLTVQKPLQRRRSHAPVVHWTVEFNHYNKVRALAAGEACQFTIDAARRPKFREALAAAGRSIIGNHNFLIADTATGLEILRVE